MCLVEKSQKMQCKEIEYYIWEYIEDSLDKEQQQKMVEHFDSCVSCASLEKGMRASMALIDGSKKTEVDPFFYTRLEARLETRVQITRKSYAIKYSIAASVAFIGIVGGSLLGSFSAEQINSTFAEKPAIEQNDDFGFELADNNFDLLNDFE